MSRKSPNSGRRKVVFKFLMSAGVTMSSNLIPLVTMSMLCLAVLGWWANKLLVIELGRRSGSTRLLWKGLEGIFPVSVWRWIFLNHFSQSIV
ncbi:hypothetical protein LINPERHAP2_LOCUS20905 [Linum perenne]